MTHNFFERVIVLSSESHPERVGATGVIVAWTPTDETDELEKVEDMDLHSYVVRFDDVEDDLDFMPDELRGTGELVEQRQSFSGQSLRVRVEDGWGHIVEYVAGSPERPPAGKPANMTLGFFEKVVVLSSAQHPRHVGRTGVVVSFAPTEATDGMENIEDMELKSYGVRFDDEDERLSFLPNELKGTGEFAG